MPGALYNADNVVVGEAVLWLQPWTPTAVPPNVDDDVALFDATAMEALDWVGAGATHEGFKVNQETSTTTITIEEQSTPTAERVESKVIGIEAALAEDTLESQRLSWGGSVIVATAAGAGQPGKRVMTLSDDIQYYAAILEMRNKFGLARRIYVPKNSVTGSGETSFRRAADKRTYPVRVASICRPADIVVTDIIAPATS